MSSFSFDKYKESKKVTKARESMKNILKNRPADWNGGTYGKMRDDYLKQYLNRDKFSYDLNGDALYQQYKDQYMKQGKLAMQDTMGQAAALTGGYGSSYAETVGNQAYQGYLQQLNDVVPQLYQLAMDRYQMEGQDLYNKYGAVSDAYNTEYGQYRDKYSDWLSDRDYYTGRYDSERTWDYGQYSDKYDRAWQQYQLQQQLKKKSSSGGGYRGKGSGNDDENPTPTPPTGKADNQHMNSYRNTLGALGIQEAFNFIDELYNTGKISEEQKGILESYVKPSYRI